MDTPKSYFFCEIMNDCLIGKSTFKTYESTYTKAIKTPAKIHPLVLMVQANMCYLELPSGDQKNM